MSEMLKDTAGVGFAVSSAKALKRDVLQVLVDDHKRQLYDLSIHSQAGRFAKEASLGKQAHR